jgi:hypothetical protein
MSTFTSGRPGAGEHAPYYGRYVALVPESDAIVALERQMTESLALVRSIPESLAGHRYGPDKWTIKEVVGHVVDAERVFAYRALRFARNDRTPLPGFDENAYVPAGNFGHRLLADLIAEWDLLRLANMAFFRGLEPEAWDRRGLASDHPISVRALAYVIAGHGRHHVEILKTRYLSPGG